jgi:hypothetical protein
LRDVKIEGRKGSWIWQCCKPIRNQLPPEPKCYGKKNPILVNLVHVWNRSEKQNVEFGSMWVTDSQENSEFEIDDNIS